MSPTSASLPLFDVVGDDNGALFAAALRRRDTLVAAFTPPHKVCDNTTLLMGVCYGMPVCGFCYDYGQLYRPSREYEIFNLVVIGVLLPMLGVLGLVGNCVNAFVFTRRRMHSSLNAYLCALAFSDMTIVFTSFFLFFLENMRKRSSSIQVSKCYALLAPIMFPLGLTAQTLSVFLTLAGAFDCFVLVAAGEQLRRRCCTMTASKRAIAGIIVASCFFNLPHIFEITVVNCWSVPYQQPGYDVCPTALRQNETYYKWYYAYLYTIVMAAGPVLLLVVLNTTIIVSMRRKYSSIATKVTVPPRKKSAPALPEYCARQRRRRSMREARRFAALAACQSLPYDFCYRQQKARSFDGGGGSNGGGTLPARKAPRDVERRQLYREVLITRRPADGEANFDNDDESLKSTIDSELASYFAAATADTRAARLTGAPPPLILAAPTVRQKSAALTSDFATLTPPPDAKPNETADVMTLVLVVFLFISCNVMPLTVNFLELIFNLVNAYLIDLSNLMVVLNSSCNVIIYYVFCESYRLTLHKHFRQICRKTFGKLFAPPKRRSGDVVGGVTDRCFLTADLRSRQGIDGRDYGSVSYAYAQQRRQEYRQRGGVVVSAGTNFVGSADNGTILKKMSTE